MVGSLPLSGISDLYFPWFKVALIYLILIFAYQLLQKQMTKFVIPFLSLVLILVLFQVVHKYEVLTQNKIVVYNMGSRHFAIDFISGDSHLLLCDTALHRNSKKLERVTGNYRIKLGLDKNRTSIKSFKSNNISGLWRDDDFVVFNGISMVLIDKNNFFAVSEPINVDWALFLGNGNIDVERIQKAVSFQKGILEPSVYNSIVLKLKKSFVQRGISVYSISNKGAFIYDIP